MIISNQVENNSSLSVFKTAEMFRGLPKRHFPLIVADVPWDFETYTEDRGDRAPDYQVMALADIEAMPVAEYAADDSRLLFWVTGPFLAIGAHVPIMRAWGFEPTAMWGVWVKPTNYAYELLPKRLIPFSRGGSHMRMVDDDSFRIGMGHTTRQNAEYVIEGRRGSPPERLSKSVRQIMVEPPREHSRKPVKFYRNAEVYAAGPRLELFGREVRRGWTVRGNERGKFSR